VADALASYLLHGPAEVRFSDFVYGSETVVPVKPRDGERIEYAGLRCGNGFHRDAAFRVGIPDARDKPWEGEIEGEIVHVSRRPFQEVSFLLEFFLGYVLFLEER
jgi:hypothetical protein